MQFSGTLAARDSKLDATFDSQDLMPWDDFINRIRGKDAEPKVIAGRAHWQGHITGPLVGPTFTGHVMGTNARYDKLYWDEIDGDMSYSPQEFSFTRANVRRDRSSAQLELSLMLDNWSFRPENSWQLDATLVRTDMDGLQALLGYSYPAHGLLSGTFHGRGTHADPELTGLFDIVDPQAWGWRFDRARGEIALRHGEVRVANAELRLVPPAATNANPPPPGLLTGNFTYHTTDGQAVFDLTGAGLPLEGVTRIQTPRLPLGGNISFHLSGQGPLFAPRLDGSLRLVDLKLRNEVIGSFDAKVQSDGSKLGLQIDSAIPSGELHGNLDVSLTGIYPLSGQVTVSQIDLDPLIVSALHLSGLTGHSQIVGRFGISGALVAAGHDFSGCQSVASLAGLPIHQVAEPGSRRVALWQSRSAGAPGKSAWRRYGFPHYRVRTICRGPRAWICAWRELRILGYSADSCPTWMSAALRTWTPRLPGLFRARVSRDEYVCMTPRCATETSPRD